MDGSLFLPKTAIILICFNRLAGDLIAVLVFLSGAIRVDLTHGAFGVLAMGSWWRLGIGFNHHAQHLIATNRNVDDLIVGHKTGHLLPVQTLLQPVII